jgi:hypothetical protein
MPHAPIPGTPGGEPTAVFTLALLLPETESVGLDAETVALLVIVPNVVGAVTTISNAAEPPLAIEDAVQLTAPVRKLQPLSAETNTTPLGRVSVMVTVFAVLGPALLAVTVYVSV